MRTQAFILKSLVMLLITASFIYMVACEKEPETPQGNNKIILCEPTVDQVAYNWMEITGLASSDITTYTYPEDHGFCWSTAPNPDLNQSVKSLGKMTGLGSYSARIEGLANNTRYYFRSYTKLNEGIIYSPAAEFTTPGCGTILTITHIAGEIAPITKTVNYATVETNLTGSNKCWITQNLGSDRQALSATDATEASAGWYWQFNCKQGYKHDGTTRAPNTTWISNNSESSDWLPANDPCALLLGSGWRLPTKTEWESADAAHGWDNYNETFASVLKLHTAGYLSSSAGLLNNQESDGWYWSSSQFSEDYGYYLLIYNNSSLVLYNSKAYGYSARCLRD